MMNNHKAHVTAKFVVNEAGFTIVELLTSVTIIAILLGILIPSIKMVRTNAKVTSQKAQFASIEIALGAFKQDYGEYPPSNWLTFPPPSLFSDYCGAQKLSEALLGWDLRGFHPESGWRADGKNNTRYVYDGNSTADMEKRRGRYLDLTTANAFRLGQLFNNSAPLASFTYVLCDEFKVRKTTDTTGKIISAGAPILYYRANTASKIFDPNIVVLNTGERVYDYMDNSPIVNFQKLTANGGQGLAHPFAYLPGNNYPVFYNDIYNYTPGTTYGGNGVGYGIRDGRLEKPWPYNPDSYILISAGPDGYYGTADDIHNF